MPKTPLAAPHTPIASAKRSVRKRNLVTSPLRELPRPKENDHAAMEVKLPPPDVDSLEVCPDDDALVGNGKMGPYDSESVKRPIFSPVPLRNGGDTPTSTPDTQVDDSMDCNMMCLEEAPSSDESFEEEEFDPYLFMKQLPPYDEVDLRRPVCLPSRRLTRHSAPCLVLDLDETLVHCTVEPILNPDHVFTVTFNNEDFQVHVRCRPYLDLFLSRVAELFEVVVFTASQKVYANTLLDIIDPQRTYIKHRLFRESCLPVEGNFVKDLHILGRDLTKTIIVDNSPYAYGYQIDNGIPIESWFDNPDDDELLKLLPFLEQLQQCSDVRPAIRERYRTYELVERASLYGQSTP